MSTYLPFPSDLGIFARQLRQQGVNIAWVGSPSTVVTSAVRLGGPALYGSYAVSDFDADSSPVAKEFATKYEATYKSAPDFNGAWTYDAVHVLTLAIDNAKSLEPQKIREAIVRRTEDALRAFRVEIFRMLKYKKWEAWQEN